MTVVVFGYANVIGLVLWEWIIDIYILNFLGVIFHKHLDFIIGKVVPPEIPRGRVPNRQPCLFIINNFILLKLNEIILHQQHPILLILLYYILLNIDDTGYGQDAIMIASDFVVSDEEFLAVEEDEAIASTVLDDVVVEIGAYIARPLDDDVALEAAGDDVLLHEGGGVGECVYACAQCVSDLVEQQMWTSRLPNLHSNQIIIIELIIKHITLILNPPNINPSHPILCNQIKLNQRPTLYIPHCRTLYPKLFIFSKCVFHHQATTVLEANTTSTLFDIIVEDLATVAGEEVDAIVLAAGDYVALDDGLEGAGEDDWLAAVGEDGVLYRQLGVLVAHTQDADATVLEVRLPNYHLTTLNQHPHRSDLTP